jgi:hypothetical protein
MLMDACVSNAAVSSPIALKQIAVQRPREPQRQGAKGNYRQHNRSTPRLRPVLQNHEHQHFNHTADQNGLKQRRRPLT